MKLQKLGDVTKNLDSKRIPLNSEERIAKSKQGLYPYIGANNIVGYIDEYIFDEKILCVAEDGGNWGANQQCAVIYEGKTWVNNHAHVLVENGKANLEYIKNYLNYTNLTRYIKGATRGKLNKSVLENILLPLPEIPDQLHISNILSKAENLIAQRKESIRLLDEFLKSTFANLFDNPIKNRKGFPIVRFKELIKFLTSGGRGWGEYYNKKGERFIRSLDVQMNYISNEDTAFVVPPNNQEANRTKVQDFDILLTITGSKIGRVAMVPFNFGTGYVSQHVAIIRTKNINPLYLSYYLSDVNCGQYLIQKSFYGQTKPGLNFKQIENFVIIIPPIELQTQFTQIVEKTQALKAQYQQGLLELENLYGSLSQRAFKGELTLK